MLRRTPGRVSVRKCVGFGQILLVNHIIADVRSLHLPPCRGKEIKVRRQRTAATAALGNSPLNSLAPRWARVARPVHGATSDEEEATEHRSDSVYSKTADLTFFSPPSSLYIVSHFPARLGSPIFQE